jgi:capsular exopolysaccharide synthesis family protein
MAFSSPDERRGHASRRSGLTLAHGSAVSRTGNPQQWPAEWSPDLEPERRDFDLLHYWQIVWKHRLLIAAALIVSLALGAAVTLLTTPEFTALTTLQIDREAAKVVNTDDAPSPDQTAVGPEFFETQYGLLKSRSLAERVVQELGLTRSDAFLKASGVERHDGAEGQKRLQRDTLEAVQDGLQVNPVRGSRLVNVSFNSTDPRVAAQVANAFAENFIASNLERKFESSSYAREFLEKRIAQEKAKLEANERKLVDYATSQQIITLRDDSSTGDPGATQSLAAADLSAINTSLSAAKAARIAAEQKWRQAQGSRGLTITEVLQSPTVQQLSQTRAKLKGEYQDKLSVYKPDFPEMVQLKAQIDEVDRQIKTEASNIRESLHAQYTVALNQERALSGQVAKLKGSVLDLRDRSIQYNILQRELDSSRTLYDGLLQRYKEVGVTGGVTTNNVSIVDRASPPAKPSKPRPLLNMALASAVGLGLGLLAAFGAEALDQAIRRPADVEEKLGVPLLGSVPALPRGVTPSEAMKDLRSGFWEAYYSTRTALQFATPQGVPRSILVTSSRPGEGKSTTSLALAHSFARLGINTLLVDADLRNPSLHRALAAGDGSGLSNYLTGAKSLRDVVQPTSLATLGFISTGPLPPTPAELLAGSRLNAFLTEAEADYDLVIFDGPPVMGLADAPMIASTVEGVLLVIEAGRTGRNQAKATLKRLNMAQARMLGALLTKYDPKQASYGYGTSYEYQYHYEYGGKGKTPAVREEA